MKSIILFFSILALVIFTACQENAPPVAFFNIKPSFGNQDSVYVFNASLSSDIEDSLDYLRFRWDWENDGSWDTEFSSNQQVHHKFAFPGIYTISLEVIDQGGLAHTYSQEIKVAGAWSGVFTDPRDKHHYKTIAIGDQVWMAENLAYQMAEGSWPVGSFIGYQSRHSQIHVPVGRLYSWSAAMIVCPDGWHLPTDQEWYQLEKLINEGEEKYGPNYLDWNLTTTVGRKLKYHQEWFNESNGTNEYGFGIIPAGYRNFNGNQARAHKLAYFWTATGEATQAINRGFHYDTDGISRAYEDKRVGFSVRCVRN